MKSIGILYMLFMGMWAHGQDNMLTGTWQLHRDDSLQISVHMKVGYPEGDVLYPAELEIRSDTFKWRYHVLLVRKKDRVIRISLNRQPQENTPDLLFFNNQFDHTRTSEGNFLTLAGFEKMSTQSPKTRLHSGIATLLKSGQFRLKKTDPYPWRSELISKIVAPEKGDVYFGIRDSIHVKDKNFSIAYPLIKTKDNDTISVTLNRKTLVSEKDVRRKEPTAEYTLDSGLNILILYAENFGKTHPNAGRINTVFGTKSIMLDLKTPQDAGGSFVVLKIYYYPGNEKEREIQRKSDLTQFAGTLKRKAKRVGQLETKSQQITLALWDDAVEDGDSISLNINGRWIARGLAVKKRTQFINVTLDPGPNEIVFIADNLGAIIPNTSVLEIIDGKIRKSFMIDTNFDQNNVINIFYDYNPEK